MQAPHQTRKWLSCGLLAKPRELIYYVSRNPEGFTSLINQFTCLKGKTKGVGFVSEQHNMASSLSDKQPNRKDSRQINFRVSEQDYLKLSQSAKTLNMSVPAFVKKKAQGARIVAPLIGAKEAQELTRQLAKIGGNLNQLAKHANQGGNVPAQELQELQSEVAHIWQQLT